MSKAYVETTVLTNVLLKPGSKQETEAKLALSRYDETLLPVYSIKEWKRDRSTTIPTFTTNSCRPNR
jgi:hypothetical protein